MKSDFAKLGILFNINEVKNVNIKPEDVHVSCPSGINTRVEKRIGDLTVNDIYAAYAYKKVNARPDVLDSLSDIAASLVTDPIAKAINVVMNYRDNHKEYIKEVKKDNGINRVNSVDKSDEAKETAKKGTSSIKKWGAALVAAVVIAYAAYSCGKSGDDKSVAPAEVKTQVEDTKSAEVEVAVEEVEVEEVTPVVEEEVQEEVQEEVAPVVEEDSIQTIVDNAYNNILEVQKADPYFAQGFSKDGLTALVLYTRNDENNVLTNEEAYSYLTDLVQNRDFNVAQLYKGTKSYDAMKEVEDSFDGISEENGVFDDENMVYAALDKAVANMDEDNYVLAVGLSVMRDKANGFGVDSSSMTAARGLGLSNPDADQILNAQRHNNVDINNQNSKLTQVVYKALEEDKQFTLSR